MSRVAEPDDGAVKGAATQIVDQEVIAFAGRLFVSIRVCIFDARCRRFIKQTNNCETAGAKTLHSQEALIAVRIGGHTDYRFERSIDMNVGTVFQCRTKAGEEFAQQQKDGNSADRAVGRSRRQKPLERAIKRPFRILRDSSRVETVSALVTTNRNQRRNPLLSIAFVIFEADNRIIAAVGYGHNCTSCTKINSKPHAYSLPVFLSEEVP